MKIGRQPPPPPGGATPNTVTRSTRWGLVVQKWPRKRGPATEGYDYYRQQEFAMVSRMMKFADPVAVETAIEWTKGTDQVPRDVLMMAAMGTLFTIETEDGEVWESGRLANPNAQYILDGVTSVHGSILYRAPIGWVGLPPGNPGQVLQVTSGGLPIWAGQGGQGGAVWWEIAKKNYATDGGFNSVEADVTGFNDVIVIARNITFSASQRPYVRFQTEDSGTTWLSGADMAEINAAGIATTPSIFDLWSTGSTSSRSGFLTVSNISNDGVPKPMFSVNQALAGYLSADWSPIRAVQCIFTGGADCTNGLVSIMAR